jgi:exonuclease VII small subunit
MENNMAFFARSKGADTILKQFEEKKQQLEQQIKRLEQELKTLRTVKPGNA